MKEQEKIDLINRIVWWIPIKKLRNDIRNKLIDKYTKPIIEHVDFHIVNHCNLGCYGCSTYSQLAPTSYYDEYYFQKDVKILSKITSGRIKIVSLIGGEPLLNNNCYKYMYILRKYFSNSTIFIYTNGLFLHKQKEHFWKACKENDVFILITKYPIKINFNEIIKLCNNNNIKFGFTDASREKIKESYNISLDIKGKQNIKESFINCDEKFCYQVYNGKFYMCPDMAYINYFNKYFNQNLEVTEKDYLELDKMSLKDLKKYISNPIPFCRYCHKPINIVGPWRPSKKVIDEYLYKPK